MKDITPDRGGAGSTYGGTQSGDKDAPDGYQKPNPNKEGETENTAAAGGLGDEYESRSSYGNELPDPASSDDNSRDSTSEEAGPIR